MAESQKLELWHLTFSSSTRYALFPQEDLRRRALRRVLEIAARDLALYSLVDDHLHLVPHCINTRIATLRRTIKLALRPYVAGTIDVKCKPVNGRSHMMWLLRYFLLQVVKHAVKRVHPALWAGSCFQDLCGARALNDIGSKLGEALPRLAGLDPHEIVGLPRRTITPASDDTIRAAGAVRLVEAASVSLLVGPALEGKSKPVMLAKRVIAQLGRRVAIPTSDLVWALNVDESAISRWQKPVLDERLVQAVAVRIALENLVTQ